MTARPHLSLSRILGRTVNLVERNATACAVFTAATFAISVGIYWLVPNEDNWSYFLALVVAVAGYAYVAYVLTRSMLAESGIDLSSSGFLAYFALGLLMVLGILLGALLLIIPGLILIARWAIALPISLQRETTIAEPFKLSWDRTAGNTIPILLATLVLGVVFYAPEIILSYVGDSAKIGVVLIASLFDAIAGAFFTALSVALFIDLDDGLVSRVEHSNEPAA